MKSPLPACGERSDCRNFSSAIRVRGTFDMGGANSTKTDRARRLRRGSTDAEMKLWHNLRSRSLCAAKFVRQQPIGPFIVDFVCREYRLIIEVDGSQHTENPNDKARDAFLRSQGYRVLRFWNHDVLTNATACLKRSPTLWQRRYPLTRRALRVDLSPQAGRGDNRARHIQPILCFGIVSRRQKIKYLSLARELPLPACGERSDCRHSFRQSG